MFDDEQGSRLVVELLGATVWQSSVPIPVSQTRSIPSPSSGGSTYANPPANFYRALRDPYARAEAVAQVFLGVPCACGPLPHLYNGVR